MTHPNPYAPSAAIAHESSGSATPSTKRLWVAYALAPLVAPLLAAVALFAIGFSYQATHPEDVDANPMAIIFASIGLLVVGVPASYGAAGAIGMPIAFWLRSRGRLNGWTVHLAALLWVVAIGAAVAMLGLLAAVLEPAGDPLLALAGACGAGLSVIVALAPFVLLSATTFWLIGVRSSPR